MFYKDFAPTQFDPAGKGLPDRQDWLVLPLSITRDTEDPLTLSNWEVALRELGGESETVEVHRFGHWGPGWFEIILVHPDRETEVEEIEGSLENYPILDEDHFSEKEWEVMSDLWDKASTRERIEICKQAEVSIFSARSEGIPEGVECWELFS